MPTTTKKTKTSSKTKKSTAKSSGAVLKRHDNDTGSPEVQVNSLTVEIKKLQDHLKSHQKDFDAKTSLLKKVAKRRTFLKYLKQNNLERYLVVSKKLGLKV